LLFAERPGLRDDDAGAYPPPPATRQTPAHGRLADRLERGGNREHSRLPAADPGKVVTDNFRHGLTITAARPSPPSIYPSLGKIPHHVENCG